MAPSRAARLSSACGLRRMRRSHSRRHRVDKHWARQLDLRHVVERHRRLARETVCGRRQRGADEGRRGSRRISRGHCCPAGDIDLPVVSGPIGRTEDPFEVLHGGSIDLQRRDRRYRCRSGFTRSTTVERDTPAARRLPGQSGRRIRALGSWSGSSEESSRRRTKASVLSVPFVHSPRTTAIRIAASVRAPADWRARVPALAAAFHVRRPALRRATARRRSARGRTHRPRALRPRDGSS